MKKTVLREYARLIVRCGVNVQKGQEVMVYAGLDQPEFVAMVVDEAYKAKASKVIVEWNYQPLSKIHVRYQSVKTLGTGKHLEDFAGFAGIFTGDYHYGIIFFDIRFGCCQFVHLLILEHFRCQGNDFHVVLFPQFSCYGPKDTGALRLTVIFDDNCCVLVKTDVGTVFAADFFFGSNNNSFYDLAFFYHTAGCCTFDRANNYITDTGITTTGAAQYFNT